MTFFDYLCFVETYRRNHPEQRTGQVHFNVLAMLAPVAHIAEGIRGGDLDPFYVDERLNAFLNHVGGQFDD